MGPTPLCMYIGLKKEKKTDLFSYKSNHNHTIQNVHKIKNQTFDKRIG